MNNFMTLAADVMYVNNLPFMITYRQGIGLIMAAFMPNHT